MKLHIVFWYFIVILFLFQSLSCSHQTNDAHKILDKCESLVDLYPDSISKLLDTLYFLNNLSKSEQNKYLLIKVQAKDKLYQDISQDTSIFEVKKYYVKNKDFSSAVRAAYYCGRVKQERNEDKMALNEYFEAERYAEQTDNYNVCGLIQNSIAIILSEQPRKKDEAIKRLLKSTEFFRKSSDNKNEILAYGLIGDIYLTKSVDDSAVYFYQKGYKLAELTNDSLHLANFLQSLGRAYKKAGNFQQAIRYFRSSCKFLTDYSDKSRLYLNLAEIFYNMNKPDSALYSIEKSLKLQQETGNLNLLADIYKTLSNIEAENSNHYRSLFFHQTHREYLELVINERNNKQVSELEKKYNQERNCNKKYRSTLEELKIYLTVSISIIIIGLLGSFFYIKSVRHKKALLKNERSIHEAEARIYQLIKMSQNYNLKDNGFRNILLRHFEILKKAALLEIYVKGDNPQDSRLIKVFNGIVYGQETLNWDLLYQAMNEMNDGFFDKLKSSYPNLDESEFRICCMTYAKFSCPEIAIVMRLSANTVQMKRSAIRKKIGAGSQENIQEYLDKKLLS